MTNNLALRIAAVMGFLAVALGAFGAHGLKEVLIKHEATATWQTAVFYHFIHTVMLFLLALRRPVPSGPWVSFFVGILIFSGSLYVLAVTNVKWLGAITPIGGVSFLVGWAWLALSARRFDA
jgi:uncharacterized membrane protein YgdD (TMEM256/DUF423 family)